MSGTKQPGYILIVTLMMTGLTLTMATYMFIKGQLHMSYMRSMASREKAQSLALSGIAVAQSQLTQFVEKKEDQNKKPSEQERIKQFLKRVLPALNRWQEFTLTEKADGIQGVIQVCIMCENGKIDINQLYDFKKHAFKGAGQPKGDMKKVSQFICEQLQKNSGVSDIFPALEAFLKKRSYPLDDTTELLTIPAFSFLKDVVFYQPPAAKKEQTMQKKRPLYLTDIFTTWSEQQTVQPWLLSDSLCGLLELKRAASADVEQRKSQVETWVKAAKKNAEWSSTLNKQFQQLYGKDFTSLPKSIHSIFNPSFEPAVFSVLVQATVNGIAQRAYAIISLVRQTRDNVVSSTGKIKRIYWL